MNLASFDNENYSEYKDIETNLLSLNQGNNFIEDRSQLLSSCNKDNNELIEGFAVKYENPKASGSLWTDGIKGKDLIVDVNDELMRTLEKKTTLYEETLEKYKGLYSNYLKKLNNDKYYNNSLEKNEIVLLNNKLLTLAKDIDISIQKMKRQLELTRDQSKIEEAYKTQMLKEYDGTYKKLTKLLGGNSSTLLTMVEDSSIKADMYSYDFYFLFILAIGLGIYTFKKIKDI
jgi:hypothetical protein